MSNAVLQKRQQKKSICLLIYELRLLQEDQQIIIIF